MSLSKRTTAAAKIVYIVFCTTLFISGIGCSGGSGQGGFSMPPTPVEVSTVQVQKVTDKFEAVGTIEAVDAINVVAEIDAVVKALPFREGAEISRGALIAQLDDAQLAAEVQRSQAELAQRQVSYDRIKTIVDQKAGAPQDLDDAASALQVAKANLALTRARHAKTRIAAPFDGIIGARQVSIGAFVRAGQTIAEMANIDAIRVSFSAPERFLADLNQGAEVTVSTTAYPGYKLQGTIIAIEPVLDAATRSAEIVAQVENPERKFRPGMSADITAVLSSRPEAMVIPNEAVFASGNQNFVYVIKPDSTVTRTSVVLGTRLPNLVEVLEGLQPDMKVVRAGHQKLYESARVMPVSSQAASSSDVQQPVK
jgi:membrane fusion protein (multidrug efflux system)